tara:strand:- start:49 stop:1053 length:1005 start_codon:yes stop_codon:yes gene_type:complete
MTFKLPTELAEHLEQEIHTKLVKSVETQAKNYNDMWAEREAKGEKYHTIRELNYRGQIVEKPRVWREEANAGYIFIKFAMTETKYDYETAVTDYLRPMICTVDYEGCKRNAKFQAKRSIGLFESRVNGHLAVTDKITAIRLRLGNQNLIHGFVAGDTKDAEEFSIHTQMMWNYRYGANSANGYLTQYVQFRSDRRGARQEGKTVLQRLTEEEKQAKADAKKAEAVAKNEAKWERFRVLPDQINRWAAREIKKHEKMLTEAGIQKAKDQFFSHYYNKGREFDVEHHNRWVNEDLEVFKMYKEKVQKFLNNEPAVREVFGLKCNTRDDFKYVVRKS